MAEKMQVYKCEMCGNIVEVLHGGAGALDNVSDERIAVRYLESIRVVLEHGRTILERGASAVEAVEQCGALLAHPLPAAPADPASHIGQQFFAGAEDHRVARADLRATRLLALGQAGREGERLEETAHLVVLLDLLVVDNDSRSEDTHAYLSGLRDRRDEGAPLLRQRLS